MKEAKDILKRLEEGVTQVFDSDNYKNYLETMSRFYNYSFGNCVLIAMQKPDASYVAGFKAWATKFNRKVKKGEKGIQILAPCPKKKKVEVERDDGSIEEKEITYTYFRAAYVWDISQTEGDDLPQIVTKLSKGVEGFESILQKLTSISSVPVSFEEIRGTENGFYSPMEKRIAVQSGMSESQTIKTLVHEIAHSILHDREEGTEKDADRRTAEVQAESVAYTVSQYLGIDTSDYSFGYVAGWSSGRDQKELKKSLEVIHDTAVEIIKKLEAA